MSNNINYQLIIKALDHAPLATAIYATPELHIAFANKEMLKMWYSNESIIGKRFSDAFPNFDQDGFTSILLKVWKTGTTFVATDTPAEIKEGDTFHKRYFDFEYRALLDEKQQTYAILHTSIDVTERNLSRLLIRDQEQKLNLNHDLEILTHTLAHDAKNPLSIAKLGLETLRKKENLSPDTKENWFEIVNGALGSLNNIIDKTVKLSEARTYVLEKEEIYLDQMLPSWVEEAVILNNAKDIRIDISDLHPIMADKGGLYQIFSNIIGNAIKYSANNIRPSLQIYSEKTQKGVAYYIKDNGIGIPEKDINNIFLNLKRGSNALSFQGKGIGLYIVKRIMERLDGQINISSKLGKGTEVRLFFPN